MQVTRGKHPSFSELPQNLNEANCIKTMPTTILKENHPGREAFASCIEQDLHCSGQTHPHYLPPIPPSPQYSADGNGGRNANWLATTPSGIHVKVMAYALLNGNDPIGTQITAWKISSSPSAERLQRPKHLLHGI
jgi:hypothetical protein